MARDVEEKGDEMELRRDTFDWTANGDSWVGSAVDGTKARMRVWQEGGKWLAGASFRYQGKKYSIMLKGDERQELLDAVPRMERELGRSLRMLQEGRGDELPKFGEHEHLP